MLSNSSKYAIRAVLYLAMKSSETEKLKVENIASTLDIPKHFLAKLLQQLTRNKIISSSKGRYGGFFLTPLNRKQSLLAVIEAIDGPLQMKECILGLVNCSDAHPCPYHEQIKSFRANFVNQLTNESIDSALLRIGESRLRILNLDKIEPNQ